MYISDELPAREPDLLVILTNHREQIRENWLEGPADVVVEIVSPESLVRDRGDKFKEYQDAGVAEYWFFDPLSREAFVYELGSDGHYHSRALDSQGRITSGVLAGFALDPTILWDHENLVHIKLNVLVQQMLDSAPES
jgi:Uma2 family endonuclease